MIELSMTEDAELARDMESLPGDRAGRVRRLGAGCGHAPRGEPAIEIGLVNNMPDAALRRTERQFLRLIEGGAESLAVRVHMLELPGVVRSEPYRRYTRGAYQSVDALGSMRLDGLIVTGTEPRAANLADEPYWPAFTRLVDWAGEHTLSTFWSCLAAHGAVQHLSGIRRRRFEEKLSGVFTCETAAAHALTSGMSTSGMGAAFAVPHSRYNGLDAGELTRAGYRILTRSETVPADLFVREGRSLFVLAQGHPEYDTNSLLKEFRRDVRRFLAGERDTLPAKPEGYFSAAAAEVLDAFAASCRHGGGAEAATRFPMALAESTLVNSWHEPAVALFRNWLGLIAARKQAERGVLSIGAGAGVAQR